jgi:hypothetical protein
MGEAWHMRETFDRLITRMRRRAWSGVWTGRGPTPYFDTCRHVCKTLGTLAIFTRDCGHHSSGWWKNPDYERCLHLSLSFFDAETMQRGSKNQAMTDRFVDAIFGVRRRWLWCEPPYSDDGKRADVWHYRLFCDAGWNPIKPRGEVYSRELTEAGWLSFSDLQAALQSQKDGGMLLGDGA